MKKPTATISDTLRAGLAAPAVYMGFQRLTWGRAVRELVRTAIRPEPGQRILDMGCGPADILRLMPAVDYVGFDTDSRYIDSARRRFGSRGEFVLGSVDSIPPFEDASFDVVVAKGLLHHIDDDEVVRVCELARSVLRPGGRLVTVDGCFHDAQPRLHRKLTAMDRGRYVRTPQEYRRLGRAVFDDVRIDVRDDLLRIPYSLALGEFRLCGR